MNTRGVVIREVKVGESDKILTVLTEDFGKISVSARGVRKSGSKFGGARFLCYSEFTLFKSQKGYSINDCSLVKSFQHICENIETLSLASYCAEITCAVSQEKVKDAELLSLILNTLYVIDSGKIPLLQVKAVFELRCACVMGYTPNLSGCYKCGSTEGLSIEFSGEAVCKECSSVVSELETSVFKAVVFVVCSEPKKIFSFRCSNEVLTYLGRFCEQYLLKYVEIVPKSLPLFKDLFT